MNFQELLKKIDELGLTKEEIGYGDFPSELGKVETVFSRGGEGEGKRWKRVYHFVDHNIYLSMEGFYSSYNGTDFDDYEPKEVFPKEKTITVYE